MTSSLLGLLLSNLLWGWTVTATSWQPTFAAFVSLPAAMVLMFGRGWKVTINGAIMGAVLVTPMCLLFVNYVCTPLGLPAVIGNVSGMAVASVFAFVLCRYLPSLVKSEPCEKPSEALPAAAITKTPDYGVVWSLRRVLADFSEAPFFGNELASLGLLLGALLAYTWNPMSPAYGTGLLLTDKRPGVDLSAGCGDLASAMDAARLVSHLCTVGVRCAGGRSDLWRELAGDHRERTTGRTDCTAPGLRDCPAGAGLHACLHR